MMTRMRAMLGCAMFLGLGLGMSIPAKAQVAFAPQIDSFPSGVSLGVTPVVSADRRYVRMTINPQFTALEGFTEFSVPAAVSGGGSIGNGGMRNITVAAGMGGVGAPGDNSYEASAVLNGYPAYSEPYYWPEQRPRAQSSKRTSKAKAKAKVKRPLPAAR
jgi:hypothetical protein